MLGASFTPSWHELSWEYLFDYLRDMDATPPGFEVLPPLQGTCWLGLGVPQSALSTA